MPSSLLKAEPSPLSPALVSSGCPSIPAQSTMQCQGRHPCVGKSWQTVGRQSVQGHLMRHQGILSLFGNIITGMLTSQHG